MLIKILGAIDVVAGIFLFLISKINLPIQIILILGVLLLIKSSLGMFKDFGSWIDFIGGIILLLSSIVSIPFILGIIPGLLLIQKGAISFI